MLNPNDHEQLQLILEFLRQAEDAGFDTKGLRRYALTLFGVPLD